MRGRGKLHLNKTRVSTTATQWIASAKFWGLQPWQLDRSLSERYGRRMVSINWQSPLFPGFTIPCQLNAEGHPHPSTWDPPSGTRSADKHCSAQCQPAWLSSLCSASLEAIHAPSHLPISHPYSFSHHSLFSFLISVLLLLWALSLYLLAFCCYFFLYNCAVHIKSEKGNQENTFCTSIPTAQCYFSQEAFD